MAPPTASFTTLAGVPVHYDREPVSTYGSRGVPKSFRSESGFTASLERCFEELWQVCPFGRAEVIASAGAYVNKPGQHGVGRAFDLDGVFWQGKDFVTLTDGFNAGNRKFYYAVECILRRHFGQVLNFDYNADHRDHFHIDAAQPLGLRKNSTAVTLFVQGTLQRVYGLPVAIDGGWGSVTEAAFQQAAATAGVGRVTSTDEWLEFLSRTAVRAFEEAVSAGPPTVEPEVIHSPAALLQGVYEVIRRELGTTPLRKPVESALDAFASHPETQVWIEQHQ